MVERCVRDAKVAGSNPVTSTNIKTMESLETSHFQRFFTFYVFPVFYIFKFNFTLFHPFMCGTHGVPLLTIYLNESRFISIILMSHYTIACIFIHYYGLKIEPELMLRLYSN